MYPLINKSPTMAFFSDDCQPEYATLHVPEPALETYKATAPWSKFGSIVALKEDDPGWDSKLNGNNIVFADVHVEHICLEQWDTDGNGKLSLEEAAAVTDLGTAFKASNIAAFNELKYFTGLTAIGDKAFYECKKLERITLPDGIKMVGNDAFYSCTNLPSIKLPDTVTELGEYVFYYCYQFTSLNLPKGVTKIPVCAYAYCYGLKEIDIPDHITEIQSDAFSGLKNLTKIFIPSSVKKISRILNYNSIVEVHIPDTKAWLNIEFNRGIGTSYRLFANGNEVKEVVIPDGMTKIGNFQFGGLDGKGCISLTSVTLPTSVTEIGYNAFAGCTNLVSADIPNSVKYIGQSAFKGCMGLTSVLVPIENEYDLGDSAFGGCSNLADVYLPLKEPFGINRGSSAPFYGVSGSATLHVPAESVEAYKNKNYWTYWFSNIVALQPGDPGYEEPDDVTLTAKNCTRVYGELNPAFEYTVTSGAIKSGEPTITCAATATSPVGTYDVVIAKGTVSNNIIELVNGTLTVTKAPLTVTAKSYTIKQGEPLPALEATYTGFKNGETSAVLTKQPTITCAATANSEPGRYDIIVSGVTAQNYEITHVKGTLRIRGLGAEPGDLNSDDEVDVTDVVELIDMVLAGIYDAAGDINGDGEVDVTDVVELIDMVLAGE